MFFSLLFQNGANNIPKIRRRCKRELQITENLTFYSCQCYLTVTLSTGFAIIAETNNCVPLRFVKPLNLFFKHCVWHFHLTFHFVAQAPQQKTRILYHKSFHSAAVVPANASAIVAATHNHFDCLSTGAFSFSVVYLKRLQCPTHEMRPPGLSSAGHRKFTTFLRPIASRNWKSFRHPSTTSVRTVIFRFGTIHFTPSITPSPHRNITYYGTEQYSVSATLPATFPP